MLIYGTAWKEDTTEACVRAALAAGFRAIDTANQRKHYVEAGVGAAIAGVARDTLFLQTKYTYPRGQDHRLPYDPRAAIGAQVAQSHARSLENLGTTWIDSYVLHGPWAGEGWVAQDREAWRAMEALHASGAVRALGVSNVSLEQLEAACEDATIRPAAVQNRCYARHGWDADVRAFCRKHGIAYQGFSLLTANRRELDGPVARTIANRWGATVPQVVFRFALAVGMTPLTGTTDPRHMAEDLAAPALALTDADVAALEAIGG